jgi:hypothetical protein
MLTCGEILPTHDYRNRGDALAWITNGFGPSSLVRSGGAISNIGCMAPQPFATGVNRS